MVPSYLLLVSLNIPVHPNLYSILIEVNAQNKQFMLSIIIFFIIILL